MLVHAQPKNIESGGEPNDQIGGGERVIVRSLCILSRLSLWERGPF